MYTGTLVCVCRRADLRAQHCYLVANVLTVSFLMLQVALDGMPSDVAKKRTNTIYKSHEPNWENQTFEFFMRGTNLYGVTLAGIYVKGAGVYVSIYLLEV